MYVHARTHRIITAKFTRRMTELYPGSESHICYAAAISFSRMTESTCFRSHFLGVVTRGRKFLIGTNTIVLHTEHNAAHPISVQ